MRGEIDFKSGRNSKGQFVKGSSGWNVGLTKETNNSVKKQSEWLKLNHPLRGKTPWNKDRPMSEESKIKESISKTGVPAKYFKMTKYDNIKNLISKRKMNSSEKKVYDFTKKRQLPLIYTGNGLFWITGNVDTKTGNHEIFNPDFINVDKNKIVEVYSRWHTTIESNKKRDARREEVYKNNGYELLIVWDNEIKRNPEIELNKIEEYVR
jgi:hypothetical protein